MTTSTATPALPTPTPEELDDLIFFARVGELSSLQTSIIDLCQRHACSPSTILASAIDIDESGSGSQSTLLHFAAANNHIYTLQYLLTLLSPPTIHENGVSANISATVVDKSASSLVDHQNVSGNTALHWGAMNGHLEIVKVLLAGGADVGVLNKAGQDAIYLAEVGGKEGGQDCADWMLKHGIGLDSGVGGEGGNEGEAETEAEGETSSFPEEKAEDGNEIGDLTKGVEKTHMEDLG